MANNFNTLIPVESMMSNQNRTTADFIYLTYFDENKIRFINNIGKLHESSDIKYYMRKHRTIKWHTNSHNFTFGIQRKIEALTFFYYFQNANNRIIIFTYMVNVSNKNINKGKNTPFFFNNYNSLIKFLTIEGASYVKSQIGAVFPKSPLFYKTAVPGRGDISQSYIIGILSRNSLYFNNNKHQVGFAGVPPAVLPALPFNNSFNTAGLYMFGDTIKFYCKKILKLNSEDYCILRNYSDLVTFANPVLNIVKTKNIATAKYIFLLHKGQWFFIHIEGNITKFYCATGMTVTNVNEANIIIRSFFINCIHRAPYINRSNVHSAGWGNYEANGNIGISNGSAWVIPYDRMLNLEQLENVILNKKLKNELFYKYSYYFKFAIKQTDDIYYGFYMFGQIKLIIKFEKEKETLLTDKLGNIISTEFDDLRNSLQIPLFTSSLGPITITSVARPHATNSQIFKSFAFKPIIATHFENMDAFDNVTEFTGAGLLSDTDNFHRTGVSTRKVVKHAMSGYACLLQCLKIHKPNIIININPINVPGTGRNDVLGADLNIKNFIDLMHNQAVTLTSFKEDRAYDYTRRTYKRYNATPISAIQEHFGLADRLVQAFIILKNPPIDKYIGSVDYKEYNNDGTGYDRAPITLSE